ncbi:MAG TPA: ATP-binding protein [Candidatus Angelobacter sp.]
MEGFARRSGIAIIMNAHGDLDKLGFDVNLAVFRIVQEALSNVHRHSHSSTATVLLARDDKDLLLEITDQGRGFPGGINGGGVGMASIRERIRLLKGLLDIRTGLQGTSITVHLPLEHSKQPSSRTATV